MASRGMREPLEGGSALCAREIADGMCKLRETGASALTRSIAKRNARVFPGDRSEFPIRIVECWAAAGRLFPDEGISTRVRVAVGLRRIRAARRQYPGTR
eukprot:943989-Rhodomonas_salina.1